MLLVATSMLTAMYRMLTNSTTHVDLGANHFERRKTASVASGLIRRLEDLGLVVEVVQPLGMLICALSGNTDLSFRTARRASTRNCPYPRYLGRQEMSRGHCIFTG
jgi:hypothetical protein